MKIDIHYYQANTSIVSNKNPPMEDPKCRKVNKVTKIQNYRVTYDMKSILLLPTDCHCSTVLDKKALNKNHLSLLNK